MTIDASIALGVKPAQIDSPLNALAQMYQIKAAQQQGQMAELTMEDRQRTFDDANKLNRLYAGAVGQDGTINRSSLYRDLAAGGMGSKIPSIQKGFAEGDEALGKVAKQKVDLVDAKLKQSRAMLDGVRTAEQYLSWHEANHTDPVLGPELASRGVTAEQARASITAALQQPGGLQRLLQQSALGVERFTEMNKPTMSTQNLGGTSQVVSTPGMGGTPTVLSSTPITESADGRASRAQALALANAARAQSERHFSVTQENSKGQIVQTDSGPVLVNTRTGKGQIVNGPDGQPLPGVTKPLNDSQSKALLFGTRMQEANKILSQLAGEGTITSVLGSRMPLIGGVIGAASSGNQQMLDQAKRDFMTAVLRRESGAAISSGEYDNADKQYFPQIGERDPKVLAQKARNRELAINGILVEVPAKQRGAITPKAAAPVDIRAAADAILQGGK